MKRILSVVTLIAFILTCVPVWAADEASGSKVTVLHEFASGESGTNWSTVSVEDVTYNDGYDLVWTPGDKLGSSNHIAHFSDYTAPVKLSELVAYNPDITVNVRYKTTSELSFGISFYWYANGCNTAGGVSRNKITGDGTWQVYSAKLADLYAFTQKSTSTGIAANWNGQSIYIALDNQNPAQDGTGVFSGTESDSVYIDSWWLEGVDMNDFVNTDVTILKEFMQNQSGTNWTTVSEPGITYNDGYDLIWTPGENLNTTNYLAPISGYLSPVDIADIAEFNSTATVNIRYKTTSPLDFGVSFYWFENGCKTSGGVSRNKVTGDGTWQVFSMSLAELYAFTQKSTSTDIAANWDGKSIYLALDNMNPGGSVFSGSASDSVYVDSWWLEGVDVYDLIDPETTLMHEFAEGESSDRWEITSEEGITYNNGFDAKWTPGENLNTVGYLATLSSYEAPVKLADLVKYNPDITVNVRYKTTSALDFGVSFYWYANGAKAAGGVSRNKVSGDGTWQVYTRKLSELLSCTTASNATEVAANWNGKSIYLALDNQNPPQNGAGVFSGSETDSVYVDSWWLEGVDADAFAASNETRLCEFGTSNTGSGWEIVSEDNVTYRNGYDLKWTPGERLNTTSYLTTISSYSSSVSFKEILEHNADATVNVRYKTTSPLNFGMTFYWYPGTVSTANGAVRNKVTGDGTWQIFTKKLSDLTAAADASAAAQENWDGKSIYLALDNVNPKSNEVGVFSGTAQDSVYVDSWWIDGVNLYNLEYPEKFTYTAMSDNTAYITGYTSLLTEDELKNLVIPQTLGRNNEYTVISVDGFENNTLIESVTLPSTVTGIGAGAFYNCTGLTKVTMPAVKEIGNEAFRQTGISMLNSDKNGVLIFPESLTTIGNAAFRACHGVKDVIFSANISSVGNYAFYRSSGLESFYFPDTMTMSADAYYYLYDGFEGLDDVKIYAGKNAEVTGYRDDPKAADIYQAQDSVGVSDGNMLYANLITENGAILVVDESYTDSYGQPLNGTSKTVGKNSISFTGFIYNTADSAKDFTLVLTVKSAENELKAVAAANHTIGAYKADYADCALTLPEGTAIEDGDEIRVIVLSDLETIVPMSSKYNGMTVDAGKIEYDVMAIGNSFAQDSMAHLKEIAAADGIIINSYDCYIGGQTLGGHYTHLLADDAAYEILPEGESSGEMISINNMLTYRDWDFVLLQGTTHDTHFDESLWNDDSEAWTALTEAVQAKAPQAKRYVHATWAPYSEQAAVVQSENPDHIPNDETLDARGDYTKALIPHQEFGAEIFSTEARYDNSGKKAYVPTMVAVDYLIRHYGFDEHTGTLTDSATSTTNKHWDDASLTGVYRDTTCHLTRYVGKTLAGFVWYEMLTGNDARNNPYTNSVLTDEQMTMLKEAAHYACTNYAAYDPAMVSENN